MIKKITIIIFIFTIIISCGKKGDPEYKAIKNINNSLQVI
tara:strand:+ start:572 stop:691 length:120 start_codon:yes stop_codon:yes gene_type:complete